MKVAIIFIFSLLLLFSTNTENRIKKTSAKSELISSIDLSAWPIIPKGIFIATQTGSKKLLPAKAKQIFKKFGMTHLMTPSGIHLSALLLFLSLLIPKRFKILIIAGLLITCVQLEGLYSLKRVLIFHLFNWVLKSSKNKNQYSFILTFVTDIILGNYLSSPLSFTFSFLFWGIIIFHQGSKIEMAFNLFLAQLMVCFYGQAVINPLALIINPLITSLFSIIFPLLSINYWLVDFDLLNSFSLSFISGIYHFVFIIDKYLPLEFIPSASIMLLIILNFITKLRYALLITVFLYTAQLGQRSTNPKMADYIIPFSVRQELLVTKRSNIKFLESSCHKKLKNSFWEYLCKSKNTRFGGPILP